MPASPIRKLVPYGDAAKARGVHVYHLNIGQPDIPTPKQFMEAVRKADLDIVAYSHSGGIPEVVDKFVEYYGRIGIELTRENLLVTTGGSEALRFAYLACLDPGDEVIIPEPFYANYNGFAIDAGANVVPITTTIENNFDLPEIEDFELLIRPRTKAILICNPSNPTGKLYERKDLLKLRDLVQKHNLFLIVDEVYREFVYDGKEHYSALKLVGIEDHVVVVDSISKRYSACGARVGNLVSHNKKVITTALKFAQARLSPPTLAQIGAGALVDVEPEYFERVRKEYVARRDAMIKALRAMPGVKVPLASGAFYTTVRLPVDDAETFCQWMLEHFEYEGATVMMAPAAGFYATESLGTDEVRIAYVLNREDLEKAMECLARGLQVYPGRRVPEAAASKGN